MKAVAAILGVILLASLAANYIQYVQMQEKDRAVAGLQSEVADLKKTIAERPVVPVEEGEPEPQPEPEPEPQQPAPAPPVAVGGGESSQSIAAVAVRQVVVSEGFFQRTQLEGLIMNITVDIRDGRGLVLVNTEIPAGVDFQTSARTAVRVAQQHANADLSGKDVIFSITSNGNDNDDQSEEELRAVDGPSAGAAMTLLLISELQSQEIDGTILVTGTIEPDGTIGSVGGVPEKALAAGEYGAKTLLVPAGEAVYESQVCEERQEGIFVYRSCTSEQKPLSPATEERYGMKVAEVDTISQALEYF
jgi:uncharacterized protein